MKRSLIVLVALVTLSVPVVCAAAPPHPGPYAAGFLGVSAASDTDVGSTDFFTGRSFNDRVEFDPGIFVGGAFGYDFGMIRAEGEISYKHAEISAITDQSDGFRFGNVDGYVGAFAFMANAFFDVHNDSPVTPYFGGGIGFAALHISDTFGTDFRGTPAFRPLLYAEDDAVVFAYQAGAGVEIALNPMLSLDVGYRYFGTERATFDENPAIATNLKLESHNGMVGVRVRFW